MIINPELQRNVWLELSPQRLLITPLLIMAILFIAFKFGGDASASYTALCIYLFFAYVWATRSASDAICDEINNNTWDWQRTSQLSPLQMSLGKLFGSTCFAWYSAGIALFAFLWFGKNHVEMIGTKTFVIVVGAILTQALALLLSLESLKDNNKSKVKSFHYFVGALLIGAHISSSIYLLTTNEFQIESINWFNFKFNLTAFALSSLSIFCAWTLIGLYRSIRLELQYKNIPWVFTCFALYLMVYFAGFSKMDNMNFIKENFEGSQLLMSGPLFTAFIIAVTLSYLMIFADRISKLDYVKLGTAFKRRGIQKGLERLPRWPIALTLALITGLWFATAKSISWDTMAGSVALKPSVLAFSTLLLLVRDGLIAHYFKFGTNLKRTTLTILFYLFVLYVIIPVILMLVQASSLAAAFRPGIGYYPGYSIFGPLVQVIIVGYFVIKRWNSKTA